MPTPKQGYYIDGERIPSVTTIISRFKDSQDLISWAARMAREGKDHNQERDAAAAVGTATHHCIECILNGEQPPPDVLEMHGVRPEDAQKVRNAYQSFLDWREANPFDVVEMETQLKSNVHRFGGTFDAVLRMSDGSTVVADWKTSNKIRNDNFVQIAAYHILWSECRPNEDISSLLVLRLDKSGGYEECRLSCGDERLTKLKTYFLSLLLAYRAAKDAGVLYEKRGR